MADSIKMAGQMALGRERLYNFSVSLNSGDKLLKAIQKKRPRKFHLFTTPKKGASNLYSLESARKMGSCTIQAALVSQSAAMILS